MQIVDSTGSGQGAILRAVVVDGEIVDTVIIEQGISYSNETKEVIVDSVELLLFNQISKVTINSNERFGFESQLETGILLFYGCEQSAGIYDDNGSEHSPIIGWAKDGNLSMVDSAILILRMQTQHRSPTSTH